MLGSFYVVDQANTQLCFVNASDAEKKSRVESYFFSKLCKSVGTVDRSQIASEPHPKHKDNQSRGHHYLHSDEHPVIIEWHKSVFKNDKSNHKNFKDWEADVLELMSETEFKN